MAVSNQVSSVLWVFKFKYAEYLKLPLPLVKYQYMQYGAELLSTRCLTKLGIM